MKRALFVVLAAMLFTQMPSLVQAADTDPIDPVAHTPDATKVLQTTVKQTTVIDAPVAMVFTEYTFTNQEVASQYFYGICSFLESDMSEASPEGMAYLDLPQAGNPMCGYARMKGTQAYTAVTNGNRVLTIWAYGAGFGEGSGAFMEMFMRASTAMTDNAKVPVSDSVGAPWKVDTHDVDVTKYAQTAYESRS